MKARQSSKVRELAESVKTAAVLTLGEQAKALRIPRSTAWTIRKASHKASGLSASIINRMLAAPELPPLARTKILEYVEEKAAGLYGGAGVNAVSSLRGFQSRNCRYAGKLSPLSFRSTTGSPVRTARGPGSSQTADPALRS